MTPRYQAYYCEENIWQLCQEEGFAAARAVMISNAAKTCPLWHQRAAPVSDQCVVWDYHVILLRAAARGWEVWDLDTTLGCPVGLSAYLRQTFAPPGALEARYEPRFRVMEAAAYVEGLRSDRSHMRGQGGVWLQPPPPWPAPTRAGEAPNLMRLLDMGAPSPGEVHTLTSLCAALQVSAWR
jgi:hypothetical protein